ncbi:MAG: ion transporter [Gammaproteobacteria bacterium]
MRDRIYEIIFEADTRIGRLFDLLLLFSILISVTAVALESIATLQARYGGWFDAIEWFFTLLFTVEYLLRLATVGRPWKYATSFFGVVDLLAILPTYLSLLFPGTESLLVIRALRLLRVFRILKLARYVHQASLLRQAMQASMTKITIFLYTVFTLVIIIGTLMYLIEGVEAGFTSIPRSVYWAVVTITTVGYGDIAPITPLGQALAAVTMILGYSVIAVPTGIITVEMAQQRRVTTRVCPQCSHEGHEVNANFCHACGAGLES